MQVGSCSCSTKPVRSPGLSALRILYAIAALRDLYQRPATPFHGVDAVHAGSSERGGDRRNGGRGGNRASAEQFVRPGCDDTISMLEIDWFCDHSTRGETVCETVITDGDTVQWTVVEGDTQRHRVSPTTSYSRAATATCRLSDRRPSSRQHRNVLAWTFNGAPAWTTTTTVTSIPTMLGRIVVQARQRRAHRLRRAPRRRPRPPHRPRPVRRLLRTSVTGLALADTERHARRPAYLPRRRPAGISGDANCDGEVDESDVIVVLLEYAGLASSACAATATWTATATAIRQTPWRSFATRPASQTMSRPIAHRSASRADTNPQYFTTVRPPRPCYYAAVYCQCDACQVSSPRR